MCMQQRDPREEKNDRITINLLVAWLDQINDEDSISTQRNQRRFSYQSATAY